MSLTIALARGTFSRLPLKNPRSAISQNTLLSEKKQSFGFSHNLQQRASNLCAKVPRAFFSLPSSYRTLPQIFENATKQYSKSNFLGSKGASGSFEWITYEEFGAQVRAACSVFVSLGVKKNDRVALVSNNRIEWAIAAYATYSVGAQLVPMYEAQAESDRKHILKDSQAFLLCVSKKNILEDLQELFQKEPSAYNVKATICFEEDESNPASWKALMRDALQKNPPLPDVGLTSDDLAMIIYTSGTSGVPKGVMLSHQNISSNVYAFEVGWKQYLGARDVCLSFLPWSHVYAQTGELHNVFNLGGSIAISEGPLFIEKNLKEVKPNVIFSVPALFNRIYTGVRNRVAAQSKAVQFIFDTAVKVATARQTKLEQGQAPGFFLDTAYGLFDKLVFKKIYEAFGGRLKFSISGGAALSPEVARFFASVGVPVYEGYGATETSPVLSVNVPSKWKIGTTGPPLVNVKVFITDLEGKPLPDGEEGEITAAGPNIMKGYYKNQKATDENIIVIDGHRCFKTGDLGVMVDGCLKITGRIKEQYKLLNGKFVVPGPLEEKLKLSRFVHQVMVYGDDRLCNIALVVPLLDALKNWATSNGVKFQTNEELFNSPQVYNMMLTELKTYCASAKHYEIPQDFVFIEEEFSVANDLITQKQSIKRRNVIKRYKTLIDSVYERKEKASQAATKTSM